MDLNKRGAQMREVCERQRVATLTTSDEC